MKKKVEGGEGGREGEKERGRGRKGGREREGEGIESSRGSRGEFFGLKKPQLLLSEQWKNGCGLVKSGKEPPCKICF